MSKFKNELHFLGHLVAFESAARLGSFTLAGRDLGISRTAVSYHIKEIEAELGTVLFRRLNQSVRLTSDGEKLYAASRDALQSLLDTSLSIKGPSTQSSLVVTTTTGFASFWISPKISIFSEKFPDIELKLIIDDNYINLENENIDVAIRYYPIDQTDHTCQHLLGYSIAPTCGAKLITKLDKRSNPLELLHERLIYLEGRYDQRSKWKTWFKSQGITIDKLPNGMSVNNYVNLIGMCEAGEGWALLGSPLIDPQIASGTLRQPLAIEQMTIGTFSIKRNSKRKNGQLADVFCDWLAEEVSPLQSNSLP
jgi:LysR family transcriptional regulator, glycine cleavage system transcriptional activator